MTSDENPRLRILYKGPVINGSPETILFGHMLKKHSVLEDKRKKNGSVNGSSLTNIKNTRSRKKNGRETKENTEGVTKTNGLKGNSVG